jgi:hypothetical protein
MAPGQLTRSASGCTTAGIATASGRGGDAKVRLDYGAVSRTRRCLDLGGLSWIYDHSYGTHMPLQETLSRVVRSDLWGRR